MADHQARSRRKSAPPDASKGISDAINKPVAESAPQPPPGSNQPLSPPSAPPIAPPPPAPARAEGFGAVVSRTLRERLAGQKSAAFSTAGSEAAFARAERIMPGGVSSPVRAFKAVGGNPIFIREAEGSFLKDIDGNPYIDYVGSYGPMIVGHANEQVVAALSKAIGRGTSFGAPTEAETQLATLIVSALPSVEMVRFVNSGTEAVMSALRLARAATGREKIIKCIGCYHGHCDALLVQAGSGAMTLGTPSSPGVDSAVASHTLLAQYNDLAQAERIFSQFPLEIAAFIVEPIAGNMGLVPPEPEYLKGLQYLCRKHGALLIFDEVMTGFRVGWGGAQGLYNLQPDITCLGKVIGGGLPIGAYGASRKLMELISPAGSVYQAGTLSGNPLAMAAGLATLEILKEPGSYETLEAVSAQLAGGIAAAAADAGVPAAVQRIGSMIGLFFVRNAGDRVRNYTDAAACNVAAFARFFHAALKQGVYLPPSQFETWFVSLAHTPAVIAESLGVIGRCFGAISQPQ